MRQTLRLTWSDPEHSSFRSAAVMAASGFVELWLGVAAEQRPLEELALPLTVADADRCAELEAVLFPGDDPWPTAAFVREVAAKHNHYVAARTRADGGDMLIGYGGISRLGRTPPFEYEVHTIGVDPAYQGRGIGTRLITALIDEARRNGQDLTLDVLAVNLRAHALYQRLGLTEVARHGDGNIRIAMRSTRPPR